MSFQFINLYRGRIQFLPKEGEEDKADTGFLDQLNDLVVCYPEVNEKETTETHIRCYRLNSRHPVLPGL
jgi:hypothetical protein